MYSHIIYNTNKVKSTFKCSNITEVQLNYIAKLQNTLVLTCPENPTGESRTISSDFMIYLQRSSSTFLLLLTASYCYFIRYLNGIINKSTLNQKNKIYVFRHINLYTYIHIYFFFFNVFYKFWYSIICFKYCKNM